jgi:hypothetical protein
MLPLSVCSVFVLFYPLTDHLHGAGVAAEIDDNSQIKYRVKNTQGVQTLKNKLKTTHSNRLFQNTNKTAKQEQDT